MGIYIYHTAQKKIQPLIVQTKRPLMYRSKT